MEISELAPGVFACLTANETANAGFVVARRGVIVIDALNTPAAGRELAAAVQAHSDQPIRLVINTHHHYDHTFGNQAFDAPVVAHVSLPSLLAQAAARDLSPLALAAWLSEHPQDRWLADELQLVYPNVMFEGNLEIDLPPSRLRVQHLGGHTSDSCIVDLPEAEVIFAGDLVFEGRTPFLRQAHIADTLQALRVVEEMGRRTVVPGHGAVCDLAYVARLHTYLDELYNVVRGLVKRGWNKGRVVDSDRLPVWWTDDRPDLLRQNVARVYDELAGTTGGV